MKVEVVEVVLTQCLRSAVQTRIAQHCYGTWKVIKVADCFGVFGPPALHFLLLEEKAHTT